MKSILLYFPFILFPLFLIAQEDIELSGNVVEQNSQFETGKVNYLTNAEIKSPGAGSTLSDSKGKFKLVFVDQPPGGVAKIYAKKNGYEIVNGEELKKAAVLGRITPLKIVLCKEGLVYENQVAYYKIAKDALLKNYKKRIVDLEKAGQNQELLLAEMQIEFKEEVTSVAQANELLLKQLKAAEQQAMALAEKWVTINVDDQSEAYQRAFTAFLESDIDLAIAILDSVDLSTRLATNLAEKAKEEALISGLQKSVSKRNKTIEQDLNQCIFQARLHQLKYEFDKAEERYQLAVESDTTNEELIFEYAFFLTDQRRFKEALRLYERVLPIYRTKSISNPDVYLFRLANTINNIGTIFHKMNEIEKAKANFEEAITIYRGLANQNPDVYLLGLAKYINNLAILLWKTNEVEAAKKKYEEALTLKRSLVEKDSATYIRDLAVTLMNVGNYYYYINKMEEAQTFLEEALDIRRTLAQEKPYQNLPAVGRILNNLGNLFEKTGEINKAELRYKESLTIRKLLAEKNPEAYLPKVANVLNNIGIFLNNHGEKEEVLPVYEEALSIYQVLAKENPAVYSPDLARTNNNIGVYFFPDDLDKSNFYYNEAMSIHQSLAKKNPSTYLPVLSSSYNNLANVAIRKDKYEEAETMYLKAISIRKQLAEKSPNAHNIKVGQTYINLAFMYEKLLTEKGEFKYKKSGITAMKDAKERLSIYGKDHRYAVTYMEYVEELLELFEKFEKKEYKLLQQIEELKKERAKVATNKEKLLVQEEIITKSKQVVAKIPSNYVLKDSLSIAYGYLSNYYIHNQEFLKAENAAKKGLKLNEPKNIIKRHLAHALLFQDKLEEAKIIYLEIKDKSYKNKTYAKIFLEDFNTLKMEGITHPDINTIKELLK